MPSRAQPRDSRRDHVPILLAERAVLARMRIEARNRKSRAGNAEPLAESRATIRPVE
jgi:hypothetical protein